MKKVIRLTESDLTRIVKRVIKESKKDFDIKRFKKLLNVARKIAIDDLEYSADAVKDMDIFDLLKEVDGIMDDEIYYELHYLADELYSGDPDDEDFDTFSYNDIYR